MEREGPDEVRHVWPTTLWSFDHRTALQMKQEVSRMLLLHRLRSKLESRGPEQLPGQGHGATALKPTMILEMQVLDRTAHHLQWKHPVRLHQGRPNAWACGLPG